MKKSILSLLLLGVFSLSLAESSFKFVKTRKEENSTKVFFLLDSEIPKESINSLSKFEVVKSVTFESGYICLDLKNQDFNDEIRNQLLELGTDIESKFIKVTNKSYYKN